MMPTIMQDPRRSCGCPRPRRCPFTAKASIGTDGRRERFQLQDPCRLLLIGGGSLVPPFAGVCIEQRRSPVPRYAGTRYWKGSFRLGSAAGCAGAPSSASLIRRRSPGIRRGGRDPLAVASDVGVERARPDRLLVLVHDRDLHRDLRGRRVRDRSTRFSSSGPAGRRLRRPAGPRAHGPRDRLDARSRRCS